jgi:hypothetical protein
LGVKATQMKLLAVDGVHSGTVREDAFRFSDAGEHVGIFSALTALIATDSQAKEDTEVGFERMCQVATTPRLICKYRRTGMATVTIDTLFWNGYSK